MTTHQAVRSSADQTSQTSPTAASRVTWLCRAPLLAAAVIICLICGFNLARVVTAQAPRNPWEAVEVLEAWRSLNGMPVYELSAQGHLDYHVYGALVPWVQGEIFRGVGPNNVSGRLLTLVSARRSGGTLGGRLAGRAIGLVPLVVAAAVILGTNNRSNQYFAENRPDMTALMFGAAGILLIGLGQERKKAGYVALGTASLLTGFFFKQTALIFAAVPPIALVMRWRRPSKSELILAMLPFTASITMIVALRFLNPTVYHYMVTVHTAFGHDLLRSARCFWDLMIDSPLFLVLLGECLILDPQSLKRDRRVRWLFAAFAVAIPFSSITAGKIGGAANSLLPALLAMAAFCVLRLPRVLEGLAVQSPPFMRFGRGAFLALLMLMSTFPHMTRSRGLFEPKNAWDQEYKQAVSLAEKLPGKVICPEDPTIALYAKGYAGQNIFVEFDTHLVNGEWPTVPPAPFLANCKTADYVVDVAEYWQDLVTGNLLRSLGFEPAPEIGPELSCYRVWRRHGLGSQANMGQTALNVTTHDDPHRTSHQ